MSLYIRISQSGVSYEELANELGINVGDIVRVSLNKPDAKVDLKKIDKALAKLDKSKNLKTIDMEISLMNHFNFLQNSIVPNVSNGIFDSTHGFLHECDLLILSKARYATEVEIKISKSDLKADIKKEHFHESDFIKYFYFAVPKWLEEFALEHIPSRAGLIVVSGDKRISVIRKPMINKNHIKWSKEHELKLLKLGTMRIMNLKKNIVKLRDK